MEGRYSVDLGSGDLMENLSCTSASFAKSHILNAAASGEVIGVVAAAGMNCDLTTAYISSAAGLQNTPAVTKVNVVGKIMFW